VNKDDEPILQNFSLSESKDETEIEMCKTSEKIENKSDESQVQAIAMSECETTQTLDSNDVKDVDDNDNSEIETSKSVENSQTYDANYTKETVTQDEELNLSAEQIGETISNNCDNEHSEDTNKQENDVKCDTRSSLEEEQTDKVTVPSSTDIYFAAEGDKLESDDKASKKKEISAVEDGIATVDEQIETGNKQDVIKHTDETQERTNDNKEKSSAVVIDTIESPEKDLQIENEKAAPNNVIETVT